MSPTDDARAETDPATPNNGNEPENSANVELEALLDRVQINPRMPEELYATVL
jgi:hypothetical protein